MVTALMTIRDARVAGVAEPKDGDTFYCLGDATSANRKFPVIFYTPGFGPSPLAYKHWKTSRGAGNALGSLRFDFPTAAKIVEVVHVTVRDDGHSVAEG